MTKSQYASLVRLLIYAVGLTALAWLAAYHVESQLDHWQSMQQMESDVKGASK